MNKKVSNLLVLDAMASDNNQKIKLSNTLIECKKVKQGGLITFGVDSETFSHISNQFAMMGISSPTHLVFMISVEKEEFDKYEKELLKKHPIT